MDKTTNGPKGRKVTSGFDWDKLEDEAAAERRGADALELLNKKPVKKKKKKKSAPKRVRHTRTQKERRLFEERMRALAALIMAVIVIALILLLTPVFDIKSITISGNKMITAGEVSGLIGDLKGTNLFLASKSSIKKQLKTLKGVNDVSVNKKLIPPTIDIEISEYIPAGYVQTANGYIVVDKNLYIIGDGTGADLETLPCITGVKVKSAVIGKTFRAENPETQDALKIFLDVTESNDITASVVSADFSDVNDIIFNYENRITVYCGSQFDLDRKLRLFCATVKSENIAADAVGTIDLSSGKAVYTP